ncbi:FDXHR family putative zinc-binding protein [Kitasatospora kifunensis]|uniref:C2H2-type domain-containing protein n=1 Tax=Kitasatospora kifunensis TaxID=58351 RepID=A0A7W7QYI8_KITKI|nr:hypothetical protein [Kitasatospora kifunensis]
MRYTQSGLPANAVTHGSCGGWWTGLGRSHCASCHETFSGESAAGRHRVGAHGVDRRCMDPATVGLVARPMPFGTLWSWPAPEVALSALRGGAVAS